MLQRLVLALRFSLTDQQNLLRDLSQLLDDGLSLAQALDIMAQASRGVRLEVLQQCQLAIRQGKGLADTLQDWLPWHVCAVIAAGEFSGELAKACAHASATLAKQRQSLSAVLAAMAYPLVVISFALAVIVFISASVFSDFQQIVALSQWPAHARGLNHFAYFISHYWHWLLSILAMLFLATAAILVYYTGSLRRYLDKLPIFHLFKAYQSAYVLQMLGLLLDKGLALQDILGRMQQRAYPYVNAHLAVMQFHLTTGRDSIATVVDTGLIAKQDVLRLQLSRRSQHLAEQLSAIGQQVEQQCHRQLILSSRVLGYSFLCLSALLALLAIVSIYDVGLLLGPASY